MKNKIISKIIIASVIWVFGVVIAGILLLYQGYKKYQEDFYKEAYGHFNEVYEHVFKNKEIYKEFSEYQLSLLNDNSSSFGIERYGENQEMRDIVFEYFDSGNVGKDGTREMTVWYFCCMPSYEINCYYCKNGVSQHESNTSKVIDDCIWIVFTRTNY